MPNAPPSSPRMAASLSTPNVTVAGVPPMARLDGQLASALLQRQRHRVEHELPADRKTEQADQQQERQELARHIRTRHSAPSFASTTRFCGPMTFCSFARNASVESSGLRHDEDARRARSGVRTATARPRADTARRIRG